MSRRHQGGFSVIELLVASTLGLLLLAATSQIFISNKQSFIAQEAMGNIQENARLAMYFLQRDVRMAGYPRQSGGFALIQGACPAVVACTYVANGNVQNPSAVFGTDETCATPAGNTHAGSFDCGNGQSDQIELQFESGTDCLGQGTGGLARNSYYVRIDPTTRVRHLMCRGNGQEQPLLEGIESMQILYGIDTAGNLNVTPPLLTSATRYLRADQLAGDDWRRIVSLRVGVMASSIDATGSYNTADNAVQRYLLLDAPVFTRNDTLRRRTFVSTIEIRNASQ